jgi:UDP-glucose 4-epimerase
LGFIGSNIAVRLAHAGARVTVIDPQIPGCGGNPYNLDPVADDVYVISRDIADMEACCDVLRSAEVIFNLAGEISHIHSMKRPWRDAALNADAHLRFLDVCSRYASGVRIVYAGTRQIFGVPRYLPVDEAHPIHPVDFNGVHKYAAARYHLLYTEMGRLDALVLNLTNVYGPRMAINIPCQGFLSNFLRRALLGQAIEIFGDGRQLRDPVYIDDVTDAFLLAGSVKDPESRRLNVGGPAALALGCIADAISSAAGALQPVLRPFPEERKRIDIGSYTTDMRLIRSTLGWRPVTRFAEGIAATIDYFWENIPHYLRPDDVEPACPLEEAQAPEPVAV